MAIDLSNDVGNGPARAPGPVAPTAVDEQVSILIVDDRADKLLALEASLSQLNENIVLARSGRDALRCLLHQEFAVILLDVNMPTMDGFETASLIRQRQRSELTPIIFVSAMNDTENHVTRGYSLGAVDYILAPVMAEILRAKVSVFVDLYRKTAQIKRQADERASWIRAEAARAEAEAARERSAFLAEASNILAGSFDPEETFAAVARHAVPRLADFCVFDVVDETGALRWLASAHKGQTSTSTDHDLREFTSGCAALGGLDVLESGKTKVCRHFGASDSKAADDGEQRASGAAGDVRSYILTPLRARGRILGTLCVASTLERDFDDAEIGLVEELAQRAGLALDNAALFQAAEHAREKAERASQAKDQFLAMLSHELRTPLTPVLNTIAFLELDDQLSEEVRASIAVIRRNVELEARLIDDLLDLTRVSKGKVQLNLETSDAHALLKSALEICHSEVVDKRIEVSIDLQAISFHLLADPARMQQIFWNLIKNAVKFTASGGRLNIATSNNPSGNFGLEVRDSGIGISPDLLPRIFNAFEQVGGGERFGGLGLGLAITKALVEMHGGEVTASSEGLGHGAKFSLTFPTVDNTKLQQPATSAGGENGEHLRLRLLLVEDHEDTNRSLSRLLVRRGYEVRAARSLETAMETARGYEFDILISDMGLPDGSGIQLMEQLSGLREVRGIALSGYGMEEDVQRSIGVGYREHLTKPVDFGRLDEVIQRIAREN